MLCVGRVMNISETGSGSVSAYFETFKTINYLQNKKELDGKICHCTGSNISNKEMFPFSRSLPDYFRLVV